MEGSLLKMLSWASSVVMIRSRWAKIDSSSISEEKAKFDAACWTALESSKPPPWFLEYLQTLGTRVAFTDPKLFHATFCLPPQSHYFWLTALFNSQPLQITAVPLKKHQQLPWFQKDQDWTPPASGRWCEKFQIHLSPRKIWLDLSKGFSFCFSSFHIFMPRDN